MYLFLVDKNIFTTYYYVRDEFKPSSNIEEAFVFFYLRKTCFRGMLRYNKKGKFNIPFGRYKTFSFDILKDIGYFDLFQRTEIFNKTFEEIFEQYNHSDNFMFLDPPYDSKFSNYGYGEFGEAEHRKLASWFYKTQNKCMMVIGDSPLISSLYSDNIIASYGKKYGFKIYDGRVGNEINNQHLIITNYTI